MKNSARSNLGNNAERISKNQRASGASSVTFPLNCTHFVHYRSALIENYTEVRSNDTVSDTGIIFTCCLINFNKYSSTTYTIPGILQTLLQLNYLRAMQAKSDTLYFMPEKTESRNFE